MSCGPNKPNGLDGYNMDLTPGVSHVNTLRGDSFSQFDARVSKEFKLYRSYSIEVIGEVFNLFNSKNSANFNGQRNKIETDPVTGVSRLVPNPSYGYAQAFAGDPGQGEQRLAQLGVRVKF